MDRIYGINPSFEALDSDIKIKKAYVVIEKSQVLEKIIKKLKEKSINIEYVDKSFIYKYSKKHDKIMLDIEEYKYKTFDEIKDKNFIVMLDKIEDPHNLGAIVRSCEAMGVGAIIIPERRNVKVNSTVYKTSAGAINHMDVCMVTNLNRTIDNLKKNGFWVYGTTLDANEYINEVDFSKKVCLVIGNEGRGISQKVKENCDKLVKIPMVGKINSLNASVACAICVYEISKNYGKK